MNDERQQMRTILAWIVGIAGWLLFIVVLIVMLAAKRTARTEAGDYRKRFASVQAKLSIHAQAEEENALVLKAAEKRLAPFIAHATAQFPDAPPGERLDKLRDWIIASEIAAKRLNIVPASFNRLRSLLKDATAFELEVSALKDSTDSLALAAELRLLFESAGLKVRATTMHTSAPDGLTGLVITSKPQFDEALGDIVRELCEATGQKNIQWVKPESGFNARDPDLKIYISPR